MSPWGSYDQKMTSMGGVMVGVVTNNKDPEELGRVKLKLPIREEENETDWVRVATMMGGKDMGSYVIPEVGDEVLVAFHLGEVRTPYVIGSLWSKKNPPPSVKKTNNSIRTFKSRSGHEITFDDNTSGSIKIKTTSGQLIELNDKDNKITISEKSNQNSVEIVGGMKNEVTVKSGNSVITLNNKGDISLESMKSLKIKSTQVTIEATATLEIKGGANVNIQSSGLLNAKGSIVKIN